MRHRQKRFPTLFRSLRDCDSNRFVVCFFCGFVCLRVHGMVWPVTMRTLHNEIKSQRSKTNENCECERWSRMRHHVQCATFDLGRVLCVAIVLFHFVVDSQISHCISVNKQYKIHLSYVSLFVFDSLQSNYRWIRHFFLWLRHQQINEFHFNFNWVCHFASSVSNQTIPKRSSVEFDVIISIFLRFLLPLIFRGRKRVSNWIGNDEKHSSKIELSNTLMFAEHRNSGRKFYIKINDQKWASSTTKQHQIGWAKHRIYFTHQKFRTFFIRSTNEEDWKVRQMSKFRAEETKKIKCQANKLNACRNINLILDELRECERRKKKVCKNMLSTGTHFSTEKRKPRKPKRRRKQSEWMSKNRLWSGNEAKASETNETKRRSTMTKTTFNDGNAANSTNEQPTARANERVKRRRAKKISEINVFFDLTSETWQQRLKIFYFVFRVPATTHRSWCAVSVCYAEFDIMYAFNVIVRALLLLLPLPVVDTAVIAAAALFQPNTPFSMILPFFLSLLFSFIFFFYFSSRVFFFSIWHSFFSVFSFIFIVFFFKFFSLRRVEKLFCRSETENYSSVGLVECIPLRFFFCFILYAQQRDKWSHSDFLALRRKK